MMRSGRWLWSYRLLMIVNEMWLVYWGWCRNRCGEVDDGTSEMIQYCAARNVGIEVKWIWSRDVTDGGGVGTYWHHHGTEWREVRLNERQKKKTTRTRGGGWSGRWRATEVNEWNNQRNYDGMWNIHGGHSFMEVVDSSRLCRSPPTCTAPTSTSIST